MLPAINEILTQEMAVKEQPTKTYHMEIYGDRIRGYTDEQDAMKQAIYKILMTERYQYIIYSWNYGIELKDLFGEPVSYVCPEVERRVTEALLQDSRIESVTDFKFDTSKRHIVAVEFTAHTMFGDIPIETEVNF